MAGKYGIGARVRDEDGDVGTIVGKRKGERRVRYSGCVGDRSWLNGAELWWAKRSLTVLDAANDDTPARAEQEQGEPAETKFKVGDRVTCSTPNTPSEGVIAFAHDSRMYLVEFKGWGKGHKGRSSRLLHFRNDYYWVASRYLTLITDPTPDWQPKVGDRVRWKGKDSHYYRRDGEYEIVSVGTGGMFHLTDEEGNREHNWSLRGLLENFEPLPVAAEAQGADDAPTGALTIQAGRHYRTRDGRKVGPVWRGNSGPFQYSHPFLYMDGETERSVTSSGTWSLDGYETLHDLVAEWPSEDPVAVAPATATPAAPKFKVGDRVRVKEDDREFVVATRNAKGVMSLRSCSGHVGFEWWRDDELLLVDSTIRPGQFATLRVKVTGISGNHANVNIPGLRNPSHGVPLSALTAA